LPTRRGTIFGSMSQFHLTPDRYLASMRAAIPTFDEFQKAIAQATDGVEAARILDLGAGTGETARRVLNRHPSGLVTVLDVSPAMLELAQADLPSNRIEQVIVGGIEQPLPSGVFDLVVSALAVHHLDGAGKSNLFQRIATALAPSGRFVLGDVVVPARAEDAVTPISAELDRPDSTDDLIAWLVAAGFAPRVTWAWRDLVVVAADRRQEQNGE
jgi:tRNA (cmo5U34)-methyltransferase